MSGRFTSIKKTNPSKVRGDTREVRTDVKLPKEDPRYAPKRKHKKIVRIVKKLKF